MNRMKPVWSTHTRGIKMALIDSLLQQVQQKKRRTSRSSYWDNGGLDTGSMISPSNLPANQSLTGAPNAAALPTSIPGDPSIDFGPPNGIPTEFFPGGGLKKVNGQWSGVEPPSNADLKNPDGSQRLYTGPTLPGLAQALLKNKLGPNGEVLDDGTNPNPLGSGSYGV